MARFCLDGIDTNENAESLAVVEAIEETKTAKGIKQGKKRALLKLAEVERGMVQHTTQTS